MKTESFGRPFAWTQPDAQDRNFVYCILCQCRLSARRSDLRKHERTYKHSIKANSETSYGHVLPQDGLERQDTALQNSSNWVKEELNTDSDGQGASVGVVPELNEAGSDSSSSCSEDEDGANFIPPYKMHRSDSDAYYANALDGGALPLQVTINENPTQSTFPLPNATFTPANNSSNYNNCLSYQAPIAKQNSSSAPSSCKITIKKVPAPQVTPINTGGGVSNTVAISRQAKPIIATHVHSSTIAESAPSFDVAPPPAVRDSFDLFFDSICTTVKSLPPKLATEGKIRVMQLVGELEMRAIEEREQKIMGNVVEETGLGQQNASVASTTK